MKMTASSLVFVGFVLFSMFCVTITYGAAIAEPPKAGDVPSKLKEGKDLLQEVDVKKAVLPVPDGEKVYISKKVIAENLGFIHGFLGALTMIIVSELGDKTFFIAAIMAMRHSRMTVFLGAIGALFVMTVLSAILGYATTVIPRQVTLYLSSALFAVFGIKMLREGYNMSPDEAKEEYEEVQAELKKRDDEYEKSSAPVQDAESGIIRGGERRRKVLGIVPRIFLQAFTLTFLAEWGDRSQIATIILGARESVTGVIIGGTLGHALCTGLAVMGGRFIAQRISVKTVTLIGGVVFIIFAFSALFIDSYET